MESKNSEDSNPIKVDSVDIKRGRMLVRVHIREGYRYSNPDISVKVLACRSSLKMHACKNNEGPLFGDVIDHTSIPHVLEHLIIDAQLRNDGTPTDKTFVGWTHWIDESNGLAEIEVNFLDDMVAVRALQDSVGLLNQLVF